MIKLHRLFSPTCSSPFINAGAYITHNATLPLNDITHNVSDNMQLPLEPQKGFKLCEIGGFTL